MSIWKIGRNRPLLFLAGIVSGIFLLVGSILTASAFSNLSTTGGVTTVGGVPSLSQVTGVGATTNDQVTLNGGFTATSGTVTNLTVTNLTSVYTTTTYSTTTNLKVDNLTWTNASGTNTTSTNLSVSTYFSSTAPTSTFNAVSTTQIYLGGDAGLIKYSQGGNNSGQIRLSSAGVSIAAQGTNGIQLSGPYMYMTTMYAAASNSYDIGGAGVEFRDIFMTRNLTGAQNVSSTLFTAYPSTLTAPAYRVGATNTGLYGTPSTVGLTIAGSRVAQWSSTEFDTYTTIGVGSNNLFDLGSAAFSFRNIYSSSTIFGASMSLTGTSTAGPYLFQPDAGAVTAMDMDVTSAAASEQAMSYEFDIDGNPFLQMYSRADAAGGLQSTSTAVRIFQPFLPMGNNSLSLGGYGNAFSNLYVSSTAYMDGLYVSQGSNVGNVVTKFESSLTNATTTPCAFQNLTGSTLIISSFHYWEASSTSQGAVSISVGTSTGAFTASVNPFVNATIQRNSDRTANVTTSTLLGGGLVWEKGEWIVCSSATTTHSGEAAILEF